MSPAFVIRLRTDSGGRVRLWTAPASGTGLSAPCCESGHGQDSDAVTCGAEQLTAKLTTPAR